MDFCRIMRRVGRKKGEIELYPEFVVDRSTDLLIRGKSFRAVWDPDKGLWSTDEYDARRMIDNELFAKRKEIESSISEGESIRVLAMNQYSSGSWRQFQNYMATLPDSKAQLDDKLTFANTDVKKSDYVTKRLPYALEPGDYSAWDELISTLYDPEERAKIEWAIGAIVAGDAKNIQKFIVLYGEAGTGKSTIIKIIQKLFVGYYTTFEAKALVSSSNAFSTEVFKDNPLVAFQHDGDLSRIEDNSKLNSIVSHEEMTMNEKYKPSYTSRINCFLFMATNKPVKITDAKSGIIRRLIDVSPSGRLIEPAHYEEIMNKINFELGAIAYHCLEVYKSMGKSAYNRYRPIQMIFKTDAFFNFVEDSIPAIKERNGLSLKQAYDMYKAYCSDSGTEEFRLPKYKFREELKNYFTDFSEVTRVDGKQVRNWYSGLKEDKFRKSEPVKKKESEWPSFTIDCSSSLLDILYADCPAQYAKDDGTPSCAWSKVTTKLKDLDTSRTHYVLVPDNHHIVIDFDLKDESGKKSKKLNLEAAAKWPSTYAEFSKGGEGIHLHYIYVGDPNELSPVFAPGIEVKVFNGKSSLRRRLSKCNKIPMATISSGLPKKEVKVINKDAVKSEKKLRELISRNLRKEIHPGTKPSVDFIAKILEDAYNSGLHYDVTDLRPAIMAFAANSTNHADYCLKLVMNMRFSSDEPSEAVRESEKSPMVFFDVEVFPGDENNEALFLVNWKYAGVGMPCVRMINPSPSDIEELFVYRLVGFNCRRYDNHMLYARYIGKPISELYSVSQRLIEGAKGFSEAYNLSYTDVYDFCSTKQSLKKWEIDIGIHHKELGLPWDKPVPKELWTKVAEYCDNDVLATEAVFNARQSDWIARQFLARLTGLTVNDTTNTLTSRFIFGQNRTPQASFNYRFLGADEGIETYTLPFADDTFTAFDAQGRPVFPGYKYAFGVSTYRGEEVGEGGYVYSEPGMYWNVALLDIASMHPSSIVAEELFGPEYTPRFQGILNARIDIKHHNWEEARKVLDGQLAPFLEGIENKSEEEQKALADNLSGALKIAINSVYGMTAAKFDNPCRDVRNIDNIVAKRGALFMVNLKHQVQSRGFKVAHIKTDSIKIPDATPEIIQFVMDYGKMYGYTFELESVYDRMCLVNKAVYIAYGKSGKHAGEWIATGEQFQHPYVYKTLFTHEKIDFRDMCETKAVSAALYLDMNEGLPEGQHNYEFVGKVGSFVPVKDGVGGGELVRIKDAKVSYATGTKGYRWMESEDFEKCRNLDDVHLGYFARLVDEAKKELSKYGDAESFCIAPEQ